MADASAETEIGAAARDTALPMGHIFAGPTGPHAKIVPVPRLSLPVQRFWVRQMQFRNLPSVDSVLADQDVAAAAESFDREWVVGLVREALETARELVRKGGDPPDAVHVARSVSQRIEDTMRAEPRPVINATGVVIHTNLGRAPLSQTAIEAANQAARGYSNLQLDLATGRRGSRQAQL